MLKKAILAGLSSLVLFGAVAEPVLDHTVARRSIITLVSLPTTLNDGAVYYFGSAYSLVAVAAADGQYSRFYVPFKCTIKKAYCHSGNSGGLASNETGTLVIRKNATSDTTVSTGVKFDATTNVVSNTALNISLAAGDYIEGKFTAPTYATNPTGAYFGLIIEIEATE